MLTPAWNIESQYPSIDSTSFQEDFLFVTTAIATIEKKNSSKDIPTLQELFKLQEKAQIILENLSTYIRCILSVDASDAKAKTKNSEVEVLVSQFTLAITPLDMLVKTCDKSFLKSILADPALEAYDFQWNQSRAKAIFLLSEAEETLLAALSTSGHTAWGTLYSNLCGTIKCHLKYPDKTETIGLAQAQAMAFQKDPGTRKVAWHAVQDAWMEHKETSAAILNALAGWRHEVNKRRSHTKALHYLDTPLQENRIEKETLTALLASCHKNLKETRQAPQMMAKILQKPRLDPWDLVAPSPLGDVEKKISFSEAIKFIREAFANVDSQMADFVDLMVKNQWIEGRVLPNKTTGAYCTNFPKSKEPRVYMTYMGSDHDVSTLAHELGHAFHGWVMRDLPKAQKTYPMTLAETASVFAETALRDLLLQKATTPEEKLDSSWNDLEASSAFLINIPARFEFERNFYDKRADRALNPEELAELMNSAWTKWYGPVLSKNDPLFWAHKLHFSLAGNQGFYNFPYSFGYLFSLNIYARREELGSNFMKTYVNILRDTGRMTAEELIQKHFQEDIKKPEFWQKSIDVVLKKLNKIEDLLQFQY
ncbi:MAG: M3 family oligoendopeptidase [Pseudobdellovibrionaceae bacterium]